MFLLDLNLALVLTWALALMGLWVVSGATALHLFIQNFLHLALQPLIGFWGKLQRLWLHVVKHQLLQVFFFASEIILTLLLVIRRLSFAFDSFLN